MKTVACFALLFMSLLLGSLELQAQFNPDKVCRVEDGQLIFTLNLKWTEKEKKQVVELFDLDSLLIDQVYKGKITITLAGESWKVKKVQGNVVELSKAASSKIDENIGVNDVFLIVDKWANFTGNEPETSATFGVNDFKVANAFVYSNPIARFYYAGGKNAKKVYISGTFNNWSTTETPMKFMGNGWLVDLNLKPGKYAYKFIVDGRWTTDPSNNLRERGGAGTDNSVVYCCNHLFELKGYRNAQKVVVTGNFSKWNPRGIAMKQTADGWSLPAYLRDGTYAYKFLVDNAWMTDPANPSVRKDADGNENSFIAIGEPYLFKLDGYLRANRVVLTGSFNGWNESELVMDKVPGGWQLPYVVAAGNYEYKFIVDGRWLVDPANPFSTGLDEFTNSFIALKANHVFELKQYPDARSVIVSGSFNGWSNRDYRMVREGGRWVFPIYLKPGKYTYKFIVNGNWIIDPDHKLYEQNEYGTYNTVLWIEPSK